MDKLFSIKTWSGFFLVSIVFSRAVCGANANFSVLGDEGVIDKKTAIVKIVELLGDYRAFRLTSASIEDVVGKYCHRSHEIIEVDEVLYEYRCDPVTGIKQFKLDSKEGGSHANHIFSIFVNFSANNYSLVKGTMEKKLGRATKSGKNFSSWKYRADKELNEIGNPVLSVSRDLSDNTADFQIGLEQGP